MHRVSSALGTIDEFLLLDARNGDKANTHWYRLLSAAFPEVAHHTLKLQLALLMLTCFQNRCSTQSVYNVLEFFSGRGGLTQAHHDKGMRCLQFDKFITPLHDCSTPEGLRLWITAVLSSTSLSFWWFGTECKSFVRMCLHQSDRRPKNGFEGDVSKPFVAAGNTLMHVTSLLILFSSLVRAEFALEQPSGSCLPNIQPLAGVLSFLKAKKTTAWLGNFGHDTPTPVQRWHSHFIFGELKCKRPACTATLCNRADGKFTGRCKQMKESQVYPKAF